MAREAGPKPMQRRSRSSSDEEVRLEVALPLPLVISLTPFDVLIAEGAILTRLVPQGLKYNSRVTGCHC